VLRRDEMHIAAEILGGILLLAWLVFLPIGRQTMMRQGKVMNATVFQYNVLPFLTGLGLIISGNLWLIPIAIVAWLLSIPFQWFFLYIFPLAVGWAYGSVLFARLYPNSKAWQYGGGAIGLVTIFFFCTIVVAYINTPPKKRRIPEQQNRMINNLNNILKCLFAILLDLYKTEFPHDSPKTNMHRAGVILNELVLEELRNHQLEFKNQNLTFVNTEKNRVLERDDIRRGIISFLAAKGALLRTWGHPDADRWISEARRLEPDVHIPRTLKDISKEISNCLSSYR
jgi:hypothetical protein